MTAKLATLLLLTAFAHTSRGQPGRCEMGGNTAAQGAGAFASRPEPFTGRAVRRCSCVLVGNSVDEAQARASAVFLGRVDSVEAVPDARASRDASAARAAPRLIRVRFRVRAVWPGGRGDSLATTGPRPVLAGERPRTPVLTDSLVWVTTPGSGPSCGFGFDRGGEYLVYADGPLTDLGTTKCSRTRRVGRARGDLKRLGQPAVDRRNPPR